MKQIEPQTLYELLQKDRLRYALLLAQLRYLPSSEDHFIEAFASDEGCCYAMVVRDSMFTWANFTDYDPLFFQEVLQRYQSLEVSIHMPPDAELEFASLPGLEMHYPPHEDYALTGQGAGEPIDPRIRMLKVEEYDLLPGGVPSHAHAREASLNTPGFRAFALFEGEKILGYISGSPMAEDLWSPRMGNWPDEEMYRKLYTAFARFVQNQGCVLMEHIVDPEDAEWFRSLGFEPCGLRYRFSYGPTTMQEFKPQFMYASLRRERLRCAGMLLEMQRKRFPLEGFCYKSGFCLITHYPYGPYAMFTDYDPEFLKRILERYPELSLSFHMPPDAELEIAPLLGLAFNGLYTDYAYEGEIPEETDDQNVHLLGVDEYHLVRQIVRNEPELKEPGARIFAWFDGEDAKGYLSCSPFVEDLWDMDIQAPNPETAAALFKAYRNTIRAQGSIPVCSGGSDDADALLAAGFKPCCVRHAYQYKKPETYYTTEMGPKLTEWVVNRIKRDYPDDIALLIGMAGCSVDGDGHSECFDYFVPAKERGLGLERSIIIGGVHHDLWPRDWALCERTANLEDHATFCLGDGVILYSRSPEDTERFEALRQQLKENLANPRIVYRKALELLDQAMGLYRNMMFNERPHQVRLAVGYIHHYLMRAVLHLNGKYSKPHQAKLADSDAKPEQFEAYYQAMVGAKSTDELKSIAHLMIQSARKFIAERKPAAGEPAFNTNYNALAEWYAETTRTWRRLRYFCGQNNPEAALVEACLLQDACNAMNDEYGLPEMDILGCFDSDDLTPLSDRATDTQQAAAAWIAERHPLVPDYATFEEFAEMNP